MSKWSKKKAKAIIISIILLTLLELFFAYKILNDYRGIYQMGIFIPLVLQPIVYYKILKEDVSFYTIRFVAIGLISIILPLTIYFTLPSYSYDMGKQLVEKHLKQSENIVFVDFTFDKNTVPIADNPKRVFISDRAYYYDVTTLEGMEHFIVNPNTGEVKKLQEGYWGSK